MPRSFNLDRRGRNGPHNWALQLLPLTVLDAVAWCRWSPRYFPTGSRPSFQTKHLNSCQVSGSKTPKMNFLKQKTSGAQEASPNVSQCLSRVALKVSLFHSVQPRSEKVSSSDCKRLGPKNSAFFAICGLWKAKLWHGLTWFHLV